MDLTDTTATSAEFALAVLKTEALCPTAEAIQQWYMDCERAAGQPFGDHPRRIYLVWANGEIDYAKSYLSVFDFCRPSGGLSIYTGKAYLDLGSGTFRPRKPAPEDAGDAGVTATAASITAPAGVTGAAPQPSGIEWARPRNHDLSRGSDCGADDLPP